jgi:serine/threonine protein kinase
MNTFLSWLSGDSMAAKLVLGGALLALLSAILIFVVAMLQGREISFWPPKIGRKEATSNDDKSRSREIEIPRPPLQSPHATRSSDPDFEISPSATHLGSRYPRNKGSPAVIAPGLSIRLQDLICTSIICETHHGIIQECAIAGNKYVLKRTEKNVYDDSAMCKLTADFGNCRRGSAEIALPLAIWIEDNCVFELLHYYDGLSLDKVIASNKYSFAGAALSDTFEDLRLALYVLHERHFVHRDICPSNLLLTSTGVVLVDPSFASQADHQRVPVGSRGYVAPEQLRGEATFKSDLFSLAATTIFLGTGKAPPTEDGPELRNSLSQMKFGTFRAAHYRSTLSLFRALISPQLTDRPEKSDHARLASSSVPWMEYREVLGVIDAQPFGYLIMHDATFHRATTTEEAREYLSKASSFGAIQLPALQEDVSRFLRGENPWLRTV